MALTLELKPESEALLVAQARARHMPIQDYLEDMVESALEASQLDGPPDFADDEPPIQAPSHAFHVRAKLVFGGRLAPLPIDEKNDIIDLYD